MVHQEEVRAVFMTYPSLYSLIMLNYWLKKGRPHYLVGILLSDIDFKKKGKKLPFWQTLNHVVNESGLRYTFYELFITYLVSSMIYFWNFLRKLMRKKKKIFTFEELSKRYAIPIYRSKDFNDKRTTFFLENVNANLIVSGFNNQIVKKRLIKFPRLGCINIHPSYLPDFRGADAAFAALFYGVKETGATIHYIDGKIDTGPIIDQEKLRIKPHDSLFSLNVRLWMHGAKMMPKILKQIGAGKVNSKPQDNRLHKYGYESFPTKEKVSILVKRGGRLITFQNICNTFRF